MIEYCVGLLFDDDMEIVVTIEKTRGPAIVVGKLNGVGGKVEFGESPLQAMMREFEEEAGVLIEDWHEFCVMPTAGRDVAIVHFFYATDSAAVSQCYTKTDEEIKVLSVNRVKLSGNLMTNLQWMIPWLCDDGVRRHHLGTLEYKN